MCRWASNFIESLSNVVTARVKVCSRAVRLLESLSQPGWEVPEKGCAPSEASPTYLEVAPERLGKLQERFVQGILKGEVSIYC